MMNDKQIDYMGKPIQEELINEEKIPNWMAALFATGIVIGIPLFFVGFIIGMQWIIDNGYIAYFAIGCTLIILSIVWYSIYKDITR